MIRASGFSPTLPTSRQAERNSRHSPPSDGVDGRPASVEWFRSREALHRCPAEWGCPRLGNTQSEYDAKDETGSTAAARITSNSWPRHCAQAIPIDTSRGCERTKTHNEHATVMVHSRRPRAGISISRSRASQASGMVLERRAHPPPALATDGISAAVRVLIASIHRISSTPHTATKSPVVPRCPASRRSSLGGARPQSSVAFAEGEEQSRC